MLCAGFGVDFVFIYCLQAAWDSLGNLEALENS
jgi:hypothetical protein